MHSVEQSSRNLHEFRIFELGEEWTVWPCFLDV